VLLTTIDETLLTQNLIKKIVSLRLKINDASMFQGQGQIFSPVLENEQIVAELASFSCKSELDFQKFVEMLYKFIIEASEKESDKGSKLPDDPIINNLAYSIRKLRNHYLHAREQGDELDVQKKYRNISAIFFDLISKRVPSDNNDWTQLTVRMVNRVEEALERTYRLVSEGAVNRKPDYEDNRIFIIDSKPSISRKITKRGMLSSLASIPVFIPNFTHAPPPEIGGTKACVYATSKPPISGQVKEFGQFVKELEKKWFSAPYLLSTYGSLNWTISGDDSCVYGCGSENLVSELGKHRRVAIGAIMQGCYGEHYDRTCFLVLFAYRKGESVLDIGVDLYLSSFPVNWNGFDDLFTAFRHFKSLQDPVKIEHFSVEPLRYLSWDSNSRRRVKLDVLGGIRREGFEPVGGDRETDVYSGIVVKSESFSKIKFKINTSWNAQNEQKLTFLKRKFLADIDESLEEIDCPINQLSELVMSVTNTVPFCSEVDAGNISSVNSPVVSAIVFDAYGGTIFGINVLCTSPRIKGSGEGPVPEIINKLMKGELTTLDFGHPREL
jgi:hypothetical protein